MEGEEVAVHWFVAGVEEVEETQFGWLLVVEEEEAVGIEQMQMEVGEKVGIEWVPEVEEMEEAVSGWVPGEVVEKPRNECVLGEAEAGEVGTGCMQMEVGETVAIG